MSKSSLPCRSDESNRRVAGSNGPSRVVGMLLSVTATKIMATEMQKVKSFILVVDHMVKQTESE
jgi:hypothetical protein